MSSSTTFVLKLGDRRKPLRCQLADSDGPINLAAAQTVKLTLRSRRTGAVVLDRVDCSLDDSANGIVRHAWTAEEATTLHDHGADTFDAEFLITWAVNDLQHIPSDGFFTVRTVPVLA